jgi:Tol biopolymer transport system component
VINQKRSKTLDKTAIALMAMLVLLIAILIGTGDHTSPRVKEFSWENQTIGAEDTAFTLTFSRPMQRTSVEANLRTDPLLPGKVSWSGRKMVYTLVKPASYGKEYQIKLANAYQRFAGSEGKQQGNPVRAFTGNFKVRDRAFAYIGVEGQEKGRLILYNLTRKTKSILTPAELAVTDFKFYPQGDRILFSGESWLDRRPGAFTQQIYTVTTGLDSPDANTKFGELKLVLDAQDYQNLRFDLSADGKTIVIQRLNRANLSEFGLWVLREGQPPQSLGGQPGGEFIMAPDGKSLAIAQAQGVAILSLNPGDKALDFLPKFGNVLSFSRDGGAAAMVKFNNDYTKSLYYVNNQGIQKEIARTSGSILDAKFDPTGTSIYALLTDLQQIKGEQPESEYQEQPYLAVIDLENPKVKPLLLLPQQRDIQMTISPDGLGILFDRVVTTAGIPPDRSLTTKDGQAISTSQLWFLPIDPANLQAKVPVQPEKLREPGFFPRWLP